MTLQSLNPEEVARTGEAIYREMYQENYEQNHRGMFVAINVNTKAATLGKSAGEALQKAKEADPHGVFHLIRVGFSGAFQLSRHQSASQDRHTK
jgi:hypothetical protein